MGDVIVNVHGVESGMGILVISFSRALNVCSRADPAGGQQGNEELKLLGGHHLPPQLQGPFMLALSSLQLWALACLVAASLPQAFPGTLRLFL